MVTLAVGSVLLLSGIGVLGSATALLVADTHGRDAAGFVSTSAQRFTGQGYALVADPVRLRAAAGDADLPGVLGEVRVRATGTSPSGVFVAIGPSAAVDTYLANVAHDPLTPPSTATSTPSTRTTPGGPPATSPAEKTFWVESASGLGPQELVWTPAPGDWALVVMNADGSRPVAADLSFGATAPGLSLVWTGLYAAGGASLAVGALVVGLALLLAAGRKVRR